MGRLVLGDGGFNLYGLLVLVRGMYRILDLNLCFCGMTTGFSADMRSEYDLQRGRLCPLKWRRAILSLSETLARGQPGFLYYIGRSAINRAEDADASGQRMTRPEFPAKAAAASSPEYCEAVNCRMGRDNLPSLSRLSHAI